MAKQRTYMCIDMKSFFASVECAERGLNPFTTNLVVADETRGRGALCLAVSPKMKALGVKNRCRMFEIPKGIDFIIAKPRMKKYIEYAADIYELYLKHIDKDDIHVYSIDESFIDVTDYLRCYKLTAKQFATRLMDEIGAVKHIPATAGIGTNLYLAKIALDITAKKVPDHIGYLNEEIYRRACLAFGRTTAEASAVETNLYNIRFSYSAYRGISIANANIEQASGTNVLESEEIQLTKNINNKIKLKFQIYGSSYSSPATLTNGGYIGSSTVNIATNANCGQHTFELKNSSGTVIKSSSTASLYASSLADGLYTVSYTGGSSWKEETAIRDHPRGVRVDATFQFRVDTTKPTMSGASTSTTGKYVNTSFTVKGTDSGSGIDKIYWMIPGAGSYSYVSSSSKTISASSANGLYRFYAVDEVGNKSSTYYVYLDTVAPAGTFSLTNGNTIASGGSTKQGVGA